MQEKYRLFAVGLGVLLCSAVPTATYAQENLERFQEQPQIIVDHSRAADAAALETGAATGVAAGEVVRGNVASRTGIDVQLLTLPPFGRAETRSANIVGRGDSTEILVTLAEIPPDLVSPSLVAEIHEGTCRDLMSDSVRTIEEFPAEYSLTPSVFSLRSFGAVLPVSLAALRSGAHAVTVRAGSEEGITAFVCIDVA